MVERNEIKFTPEGKIVEEPAKADISSNANA